MAFRMFKEALHADTRPTRVTAIATIVMLFASGAFVTSTLSFYFAPAISSSLTDVAGGAAVTVLAVIAKVAHRPPLL